MRWGKLWVTVYVPEIKGKSNSESVTMATDSVNITCLQGRFPKKEPELSPPQTFYLFSHSVQMKQKLIFLASDLDFTVLFSLCIKNNHLYILYTRCFSQGSDECWGSATLHPRIIFRSPIQRRAVIISHADSWHICISSHHLRHPLQAETEKTLCEALL